MNRLALILGLGAMVAQAAFADPAQVGSWTKGCQSGLTVKSLTGGGVACYSPASGASTSSASPILDVSMCENIDVFLYDDYDGDGTVCTVQWVIDGCPPATLSTDGTKNSSCAPLPGTITLSGDSTEAKLSAVLMRVHGNAAGSNIDSCRLLVKCAITGTE